MSVDPKIVEFPNRLREALPADGGGGNNSGMPPDGTEARIARLEADVSNIKTTLADLRIDLRDLSKKVDAHFLIGMGALATMAVGLVGVMAKGFKWI